MRTEHCPLVAKGQPACHFIYVLSGQRSTDKHGISPISGKARDTENAGYPSGGLFYVAILSLSAC